MIESIIDIDNVELRRHTSISWAFLYQGQVRYITEEDLYYGKHSSRILDHFKAAEKLVIGDLLDDKTELSAMISSTEQERAESWVEEAV